MASSSRTQVAVGAAVLSILFVTAVFFSGFLTFREQMRQIQNDARVVASATVTAAYAAHLDRAGIAAVADRLTVPPDGVMAIVDLRAGAFALLTAPPALAPSLKLDALPPDGIREDPDGTGRAYASAEDANHTWRAIVGLPRRLAWERTTPIYRRNAANVGWWYLISVGAISLFMSRWLRSLRTLNAMAARVSAGDLRTPEPAPMATSEQEQLQQTMVDMVTRVRELQRQVVRQERLAAIGVLVSGVAHEINNPLQAILGFSEVTLSRKDLPPDARQDLSVIRQESERASLIIRNLSRFTGQQQASPAPLMLGSVIHWLGELWRRRLESNHITFEVDDQSRQSAKAVSAEIQQVALNFLANAEYSILHHPHPRERRIIVRTRDLPNQSVRLEVEDTGPGVPPDQEGSLFQPFFTTKPVGEGTGLGLSVSYGIINSHGGRIGHERGALGGAVFFFEIPVMPPGAPA